MLGDLIIPADFLSISLAMGLSLTLKELTQTQNRRLWVRFLVAALCLFSSSWLNNVDGIIKDCGALQFG